MKKSLVISLLFISFFVLKATAQISSTTYIGIKGGISIPNLRAGGSENNPINSGYSSRLGPDFAVFSESFLSDKISLSTQLEYSSQGGKKNGYQAFILPKQYAVFFPPGQAPEYLYANFKNEAKINYVMLSELAKISFSLGEESPLSVYIEAGPFGALLVSAHDVTSGSGDVYEDAAMQQNLSALSGQQETIFDSTQNIRDQLHKGNFGIEGDIGAAFSIGNSKIFIEAGGNYGFLNIQKGTENGKNNIGGAAVRIGYAFGF